jgi:transcriptional regulator with XRE-family HTH domain
MTPKQHPLTRYRAERGLSQRDLAKALDVASITVSRWERGLRNIDERLLPIVERVTGIAPALLRPDLARVLG